MEISLVSGSIRKSRKPARTSTRCNRRACDGVAAAIGGLNSIAVARKLA